MLCDLGVLEDMGIELVIFSENDILFNDIPSKSWSWFLLLGRVDLYFLQKTSLTIGIILRDTSGRSTYVLRKIIRGFIHLSWFLLTDYHYRSLINTVSINAGIIEKKSMNDYSQKVSNYDHLSKLFLLLIFSSTIFIICFWWLINVFWLFSPPTFHYRRNCLEI